MTERERFQKLAELNKQQRQLDAARAALLSRNKTKAREGLEMVTSIKHILVIEFGRTRKDADDLVAIYPDVIMQALFIGPHAVRAAAMALEIVELDDVRRAGGQPVGPGDRMGL